MKSIFEMAPLELINLTTKAKPKDLKTSIMFVDEESVSVLHLSSSISFETLRDFERIIQHQMDYMILQETLHVQEKQRNGFVFLDQTDIDKILSNTHPVFKCI